LESHSKEPLGTHIFLGTLSAILLSSLIWQLITLQFYFKLAFYFGLLLITVYQIVLYGLFYETRHSKKKTIISYFWFSVTLIWMVLGIGLIAPLSHFFNVPSILFFISYFLIFFIIGITVSALTSQNR